MVSVYALMACRLVVMRLSSLITADADTDGVHHEQQRQCCEAVEPRVGGHGWNGSGRAALAAVSKRYQRLPPWSTLFMLGALADVVRSPQRLQVAVVEALSLLL